MKKTTAGIYRIGNNDSDRGYIGQSADMPGRLVGHRTALRGGYHHNEPLQNAWNKYGEDAFSFYFVEINDIAEMTDEETKALLCEREIVWWEKEPHPYNVAPPGPSMLGYKHTDEAKANMS